MVRRKQTRAANSATKPRSLETRNSQLERENRRLSRENKKLKQEITELKAKLEEEERKGKRQAAPFSKGNPKNKPKRPGRKPGSKYGKRGRRKIPEQIDEVVPVPAPEQCPDCAGAVEVEDVVSQYQIDIPPVKPHVTQFDIELGRCTCCGQRVRGRDERQNSDAVGAAAVHLGPQAMALAAKLNKELGLSHGKVVDLFGSVFNIALTRGGSAQLIARVGSKLRPTYDALVEALPRQEIISPDETGWRVCGQSCWLWVFVGVDFTIYAILPGRGFAQASEILPATYGGILARDGWAPYRGYENADHQSCTAHLLRRTHNMLETAQAGAARVPHEVRRMLKQGLALRDRRDEQTISEHGLRVATGRLQARMDRLLEWNPTDDQNRRLLKHLRTERDALFTYLENPDVPATNYWAEHAVRPAVVNRKVWGGNRTWNGAANQQVITTAFRSARQQGQDSIEITVPILRAKQPQVMPLRGIAPLDSRTSAPN